MKNKRLFRAYIYLLILFMTTMSACTQVEAPTRIALEYPDYFPTPRLIARNPLTKEGVKLGEKLFFDSVLSQNGKVSCATCHIPALSFSDGQALSSLGMSGKKMKRNAPALINLAWMERLFWDGGVHNLESLPFAALTNADEMGNNLFLITQKLNSDKEYKRLFNLVFGIDSIASAYIARALAQYQKTIIYSNSKYDGYLKGEKSLTEGEKSGLTIFEIKCASCHTSPLLTDNGYHNNGLDSIFPPGNLDLLKARKRITLDSNDLGKYKTPTLRNLKFTAPYMHDGRFSTLEEVLNHYQNGIVKSNTLDSVLVNFTLSENESKSIMLFLNTLNEEDI